MKNKLCKVLVSNLAYVAVTTLFLMQFFICRAHTEERVPVMAPVYHPSYATLVECISY